MKLVIIEGYSALPRGKRPLWKQEAYKADIVAEKLPDGTYFILKNRMGKHSIYMTYEELMMEGI